MLGRRLRVCHDPRAGLQLRDAVRDHDRPQRDARVHRPAGQHVADRARVRAAAVALELGDDLHRAHLRRAGDRAGGEARAEHVERRHAVAQLADDLGDEVRDVREALDLQRARHVHRARPADAREVVAAEVDEHHVLGPVLLRREQALGVALARRLVVPAIGHTLARPPSQATSRSGEEPTSASSPSSSRKRYGDGLTRRSAR